MLVRYCSRYRVYSTSTFPKLILNKMSINISQDYETAVEKLNSLQSNADYIQRYGRKNKDNQHLFNSALETRKFLERSGFPLEKLDKLSVIHVAGTKGKGTTCAFSESILRLHGYKTGFYSSPHLLEVRERIRINGVPISKEDFVKYFWKIYNTLDANKSGPGDMPWYFGFLTVMAFHIFADQKVDVAIVEVGIGGEYDCTNALRKTAIAVITSLGIDHTTLLGDTLESIAWNKAGIIKSGIKTFTVPQDDAALRVLKEESSKKNSELIVVDLKTDLVNQNGYPTNIINLNASLAVAVCENWIEKCSNGNGKVFSQELAQIGIKRCNWPGRYEIKNQKNLWFYLDGAHTLESITVCSNWFKEKTRDSKNKKALMFNLTGDRDSEKILKVIHRDYFDVVTFVPNQSKNDTKTDNISYLQPPDKQLIRCEDHLAKWLKLNEENPNTTNVKVFPSVLDAVNYLDDGHKYDLLVTGSLHLIGAVLGILDPNLKGTLS